LGSAPDASPSSAGAELTASTEGSVATTGSLTGDVQDDAARRGQEARHEVAPPAGDFAAEPPAAATAKDAMSPETLAPREDVAEAPGTIAQREDGAAAGATIVPRQDGAGASGTAPSVQESGQRVAQSDPNIDARLDVVARNASVSARAAGAPFRGRREVFEFLLDHPEFATHVTRVLRVARYRIWRTEDGLFLDDGWGSTGQMFVVRAVSGTRVLYARGEFQHKLLPVITGEAVVTINYDAQPAGDGRDLLVADISSQFKIDGPFGDMIVRLANTLAVEKAEKESRRLVHIFARVLKAIDEKPAALYEGLRERPDVSRHELEQFRVLLKLP
jgi:hypothetical protein